MSLGNKRDRYIRTQVCTLCKQIEKTSIIERLHQNNKEKLGAKLSLLPAFLYLLLYVVD